MFESRQKALDAGDRSILTALRHTRQVAPGMRVSWELASTHAGLWAADIVAGALTWWLGGDDDRCWQHLTDQVELLDVDER